MEAGEEGGRGGGMGVIQATGGRDAHDVIGGSATSYRRRAKNYRYRYLFASRRIGVVTRGRRA